MLRYFAYSVRDFRRSPDHSDYRLNWEIWIAFRGRVRPRFHDAPPRHVAPANFWVMPPRLRFHWHAETPEVERCVLNFAQVPAPLDQIARSRGFFSRTLDRVELAEARRIAAFGLPLLGFVVVSLLLGFYVATAVYLAGVMRIQGRYRIVPCIAVGVGTAAFFFVVLEVWFKVPLLKGPLEALVGVH